VGRLEDARQHLETSETMMRETQQFRFAPRIYLDLASLNAAQDAYDEAQECIRLAQEAAGEHPSDAFLGLMHACSGKLDARRGQWDDAVAHFERSTGFLQQAHLLGEVAKTNLRLGMAYLSRGREGDRGRACEQLLAALSLFRQMQARGYLAWVRARLDELGCQPKLADILRNEESSPPAQSS
jgi:tetratricopeptide (TPR) repeat protein